MASLLENALIFAQKAHEGQTRDNGDPYIVHPRRVVGILKDELGVTDDSTLAAAALHDTIEDCNVTQAELEALFGTAVAHAVSILTKSKDTHHNPVRIKEYLERIKRSSRNVQLIKLADRLDNLRDLKTCPDTKKVERYLKETRELFLPWVEKVDKQLAIKYRELLS